MVSRRFVTFLVVCLPLLIVAFAVLMGGYAVATAAHDATGATALWWIAMACVMLLVMDVLLLLVALGLDHIRQFHDVTRDDES